MTSYMLGLGNYCSGGGVYTFLHSGDAAAVITYQSLWHCYQQLDTLQAFYVYMENKSSSICLDLINLYLVFSGL